MTLLSDTADTVDSSINSSSSESKKRKNKRLATFKKLYKRQIYHMGNINIPIAVQRKMKIDSGYHVYLVIHPKKIEIIPDKYFDIETRSVRTYNKNKNKDKDKDKDKDRGPDISTTKTKTKSSHKKQKPTKTRHERLFDIANGI